VYAGCCLVTDADGSYHARDRGNQGSRSLIEGAAARNRSSANADPGYRARGLADRAGHEALNAECTSPLGIDMAK